MCICEDGKWNSNSNAVTKEGCGVRTPMRHGRRGGSWVKCSVQMGVGRRIRR